MVKIKTIGYPSIFFVTISPVLGFFFFGYVTKSISAACILSLIYECINFTLGFFSFKVYKISNGTLYINRILYPFRNLALDINLIEFINLDKMVVQGMSSIDILYNNEKIEVNTYLLQFEKKRLAKYMAENGISVRY